LELFEIERRKITADGASSGQLKKRPMFLDPPNDCRITSRTTKIKKKPFKKKTIMKHPSSSSSAGTAAGGPMSSPRRRTKKTSDDSLPPVSTVPPHKMIDLQPDHESIDSSFDAEENDLLLIEPIELSEVVLPIIEPIEEPKNRLPQLQGHAHQQQPVQEGCFGQMRSFDIRDCNTDNYSAIQQHHHPQQHQHQHQHFEVTMHHHQHHQRHAHHHQRHAHQQQPVQEACFRQMRSFDIRHRNTDNYSAIQQQHHPPPQQQQQHQHFEVTMHHQHQFQNNPLYYRNTYPRNENAAAEFGDRRNG